MLQYSDTPFEKNAVNVKFNEAILGLKDFLKAIKISGEMTALGEFLDSEITVLQKQNAQYNTMQNDLDIAKLKKVDDKIGLMEKRFSLNSDAILQFNKLLTLDRKALHTVLNDKSIQDWCLLQVPLQKSIREAIAIELEKKKLVSSARVLSKFDKANKNLDDLFKVIREVVGLEKKFTKSIDKFKSELIAYKNEYEQVLDNPNVDQFRVLRREMQILSARFSRMALVSYAEDLKEVGKDITSLLGDKSIQDWFFMQSAGIDAVGREIGAEHHCRRNDDVSSEVETQDKSIASECQANNSVRMLHLPENNQPQKPSF